MSKDVAKTNKNDAATGTAAGGFGLLAVRVALIAGALAAIAYGIADGEALAVFNKGVRVCLECIGLG